jgi:hypothetical protein
MQLDSFQVRCHGPASAARALAGRDLHGHSSIWQARGGLDRRSGTAVSPRAYQYQTCSNDFFNSPTSAHPQITIVDLVSLRVDRVLSAGPTERVTCVLSINATVESSAASADIFAVATDGVLGEIRLFALRGAAPSAWATVPFRTVKASDASGPIWYMAPFILPSLRAEESAICAMPGSGRRVNSHCCFLSACSDGRVLLWSSDAPVSLTNGRDPSSMYTVAEFAPLHAHIASVASAAACVVSTGSEVIVRTYSEARNMQSAHFNFQNFSRTISQQCTCTEHRDGSLCIYFCDNRIAAAIAAVQGQPRLTVYPTQVVRDHLPRIDRALPTHNHSASMTLLHHRGALFVADCGGRDGSCETGPHSNVYLFRRQAAPRADSSTNSSARTQSVSKREASMADEDASQGRWVLDFTLRGHTSRVRAMALTLSGVAVAAADCSIRMWQ